MEPSKALGRRPGSRGGVLGELAPQGLGTDMGTRLRGGRIQLLRQADTREPVISGSSLGVSTCHLVQADGAGAVGEILGAFRNPL